MNIGFIGTGLMGQPMAARILGQGATLTAYNRTREKLEPLAQSGATIADTPAAVIQAADCTVLMLTNVTAIRETVLAAASVAQLPGKTIVQMGTIAPEESRALHADITAAGGDYLEAPVLGSIPEARSGELLVMVGGTAAQYDRWLPLLQCLGPAPRLIGPVGTATALKLALNQLIGALTSAFATSLSFVQQQGVPVERFMDILRQSALYAPTFDKKLTRMVERQFDHPNFPTKHLQKDIGLFLQSSATLNLDTTTVAAIQTILAKALAQGLADTDYSSLVAAIAPAAE